MPRPSTPKRPAAKADEQNPFEMKSPEEAAAEAKPLVHLLRNGARCGTERRARPAPGDRFRIVIEATEGFIPLWAKGTTLRWRFQERSMRYFRSPDAAKASIEALFGEAVLKWGDAVPVKFAKKKDAWDFEIVMSRTDDCDASGCVLATAFFPDAGRHELWLYPKLFTLNRQERIETLVHEVGHIFGLRHYFAKQLESTWRSEIFGKHVKFSIMNYGDDSRLTAADKADLKRLYEEAWSGELTEINGVEIRFVRPFHSAGESAEDLRAAGVLPLGRAAARRR